MAEKLSLTCQCGSFKLEISKISPGIVNRAQCGCKGCQSFAKFCNRHEKITDDFGATDIIQMSQERLQFIRGQNKLSCIRQTPKGAIRWYTTCCKTPVGNTPALSQIPLIGIISSSLDQADDSALLESMAGKIKSRVFCAPPARNVGKLEMAFMVARIVALILLWISKGDLKKSPLYDTSVGHHITHPRLLSLTEYRALNP